MPNVKISLPKIVLEKADSLVEKGYFSTRSAVITEAIRQFEVKSE